MCHTCKANKKIIEYLQQRLLLIEELLAIMTNNKSYEFIRLTNDLQKCIDGCISNNICQDVISQKNKLADEIRQKNSN